jgi:hypothetical protein
VPHALRLGMLWGRYCSFDSSVCTSASNLGGANPLRGLAGRRRVISAVAGIEGADIERCSLVDVDETGTDIVAAVALSSERSPFPRPQLRFDDAVIPRKDGLSNH